MMRIRLFGEAELVDDERGRTPLSVLGTKPRQLLEILALGAGRVHGKEHLADLLWQGRPPAAATAGLESYVSVVRSRLGLGAGRGSVLATADNGYVLDRARCEVDVVTVRELHDESRLGSLSGALSAGERVDALARGELLGHEGYAPWAIEAREELEGLVARTLARGAQGALALGLPERALPLAERATALDPGDEDGWRQLMRAQWFDGAPTQALRSYSRLRAHLIEELGQEPSDETTEVYLAVLSHTSQAGAGGDHTVEIRLLLQLMRQALEGTPGARPPALDDDLSHVACRVLARG
ncbi:AfsR/SARP family transcriptional regulator [Lapillicoccus jejuensis]|uniref:DNA-binding SARP family transcriptional activator n=1 Tax=Lapillicoccus jejuensis TaxID=402171 RepID=A0A542E598_9MICO|nr:BTAD domain-containing putative transcriptional regulator [Lapillicoccus jejuensis]TQJ10505.1 DNA-binding SARP family transcriptional activator [Lapillicoccus jejuensis]